MAGAGGYLVQEVTGSQRDLLDNLTMVMSGDAPIMATIGKGGKAINMDIEWPVDTYESPRFNATPDGAPVTKTDNAFTKYAVLKNRMQWIRESAKVGKLAQNVQNQAGIPDKGAKALRKKMEQVWLNVECALGSDQEVAVGNGEDGDVTRGIGAWIASSAQSVYPVDSNYLTPSASINTTATSSLKESDVAAVVSSMWAARKKRMTYSCICGVNFKARFKDWQQFQSASPNVMTAIKVYNADISEKKIMSTVDVFETDGGVLELIPSFWLAQWDSDGDALAAAYQSARAYVLDPDRWEIRWHQTPQKEDLANDGGGRRFAVDCIAGLVCYNPYDQGKFAATA